MKLQSDMDHHNKDYFVPNFGVDREIIDSAQSLSGAEKSVGHKLYKKLVQVEKQSIPACNSSVFPKCVTEAETVAPQKL
jgi:hypothetical protein